MSDELPRRMTFDRDEDFAMYGQAAITDEKWADFWKFMYERYTDWAVSNVEYADDDEGENDE